MYAKPMQLTVEFILNIHFSYFLLLIINLIKDK